MNTSHPYDFSPTLRYFRLSVIGSGMILMHSALYAGLNGPSRSIHPSLSASSAAGKDELISEHKVVIDSFSKPNGQWQPTADIQAKVCDGDFNTSTEGEILWVEPAAQIDKRKLTPTPARFLWFHFHAESDFNYGVVNEVEIKLGEFDFHYCFTQRQCGFKCTEAKDALSKDC